MTPTLYLVIHKTRTAYVYSNTLGIGEVHNEIFPFPNIPFLTVELQTSLKLQFFLLHLTYSFCVKVFHMFMLLTDPNTLQAV